jgi:hypothetical protein
MARVHAFYPVPPIGTAKSWHAKDTNDLLSEKLLDGYSLLPDTFCPQCVTPLVKKKASTMIGSFEALPVAGVAFCVSCNEHVAAHDFDTPERCNSLKEKGETKSLDSLLDSLQKCAQRRRNMIDAFEEDRQDLVCTGSLEWPSDERPTTSAREKAEQENHAVDAVEPNATPLLKVNTSFKKPLSPTMQLYPSTNDSKRKDGISLDKEEDIEHDLRDHTHKIESLEETASRMTTLPPRPVESILLDPKEKEEVDYERKKSLPQSSIKVPEKDDADSARYVCCLFFFLLWLTIRNLTKNGYSLFFSAAILQARS